jgi:dihydrofolate reductase
MGVLVFAINLTLDGCIDHREGVADEETHAWYTRLLDQYGALLWGRVTYEMMEAYWPAVARGEVAAPPAMQDWARRLEAMPKYVVASRRATFEWSNSYLLTGDLCESVQRLKAATPQGVLLGSAMLAGALDGLGLIDEYRFLIHPRIAGHGPRLHEGALRATRALELIAANPLGNGCVAVHYRRQPAKKQDAV